MSPMPATLVSRLSWPMVRKVAIWIATKAWQRFRQNLTPEERTEFRELVVKTKGRPSALTTAERARLRALTTKAAKGEVIPAEAVEVDPSDERGAN